MTLCKIHLIRHVIFVSLGMLMLFGSTALAHPEYQTFIQENSGRNMDCAYCHSHSDGPDGMKIGQIGSLSAEELLSLGKARSAFEPGKDVHSPILNEFGNELVHVLGKKAILDLRKNPEALAEALGFESDLDDDGISDAQEYLDGTHPLIKDSGKPMKLFIANITRSKFSIVMLALATIFGLYGLNNMLRWFELVSRSDDQPNKASDNNLS